MKLSSFAVRYQETVQMRGIAGTSQPVELFLVALQVGDQAINGIHAVALPSPNEVILGRDIINQLTLTLDGLATLQTIDTNTRQGDCHRKDTNSIALPEFKV